MILYGLRGLRRRYPTHRYPTSSLATDDVIAGYDYRISGVAEKVHGGVRYPLQSAVPLPVRCTFSLVFFNCNCTCACLFKIFSAPPDDANTEYQISNREFFEFLGAYYCNFLNNVYR